MHCKRDHMSVPSLSKKLQMNFSISDLELMSTIVATLASSYLNTLCDFHHYLIFVLALYIQKLSRWPSFPFPGATYIAFSKVQNPTLTTYLSAGSPY